RQEDHECEPRGRHPPAPSEGASGAPRTGLAACLMKLYRGFATVGSIIILSRVLGFIRDVLIAAVLGTSYVADAFFVASRLPNMFRRIFAEGASDAAFIPLFAKRLHAEGAPAAQAFASQALAGLTLVLLIFTVLAEITMPWLMLLLAPGFASDPG